MFWFPSRQSLTISLIGLLVAGCRPAKENVVPEPIPAGVSAGPVDEPAVTHSSTSVTNWLRVSIRKTKDASFQATGLALTGGVVTLHPTTKVSYAQFAGQPRNTSQVSVFFELPEGWEQVKVGQSINKAWRVNFDTDEGGQSMWGNQGGQLVIESRSKNTFRLRLSNISLQPRRFIRPNRARGTLIFNGTATLTKPSAG